MHDYGNDPGTDESMITYSIIVRLTSNGALCETYNNCEIRNY